MFEDLWDAFQLFRISLHCHWCFCFSFDGAERRLRCSTFWFQFHLSIPCHSGSNSTKMRWNRISHLLRFCTCRKLIIRFARNRTAARWRKNKAAFVVHWYIAPKMKENKFRQSTVPFIYLFSLRLTTNICFGGMTVHTHEQTPAACKCINVLHHFFVVRSDCWQGSRRGNDGFCRYIIEYLSRFHLITMKRA